MNLQALLDQHGVPYRLDGQHHHARLGWVQLDCPNCAPDSGRYHLGIAEDLSRANCWRCGHVYLAGVLSQLTGLSVAEVWASLDRPLRRPASPLLRDHRPQRVIMPQGVEPIGEQHRAYLQGRGFEPPEIVRLWGVMGIGLSRNLAWRLLIPIHYEGKTVSWTTRALGDGHRRYITASPEQESMDHRSLLYGEDYVRSNVIVHEGPTDVWRTGPGAVAVLSLNYSMAQLLRIARYPMRAICFDREPSAQERARRLARELQWFPGITKVVEIETGKDVDKADPSEVSELRARYLGDK